MKNNKEKNIRKPFILMLVLFIALLILALFLYSLSSKARQSQSIKNQKLEIKTADGLITFNASGLVEFKNQKNTFEGTVDNETLKLIFQYVNNKARYAPEIKEDSVYALTIYANNGSATVVYIPTDDDFINNIINNVGGGGDGDGDDGDGGGSISDYFNTPTPGQVNPNPSSASTPTPGAGGSGPGGCVFWKLSWCLFFPSPTPTPVISQAPSITPQLTPDCDLYGSMVTRRTVISNTLCNTEEQ